MTTFEGKIERINETGGWWFVKLPAEIKQALQPYFVRGNAKVNAAIGKTTWPVTIMAMGGGVWMIPIKAEVRKAESLDAGQTVKITITPRET